MYKLTRLIGVVEVFGVDLYGYKSTTTIPAEPFYSAVSSQESNYIQYTPYPQWNNYAIQFFDWTPFDIITVSSNGSKLYPSEAGDYGYLTALDVYYRVEYVYDHNDQRLPSLSGYIGKITLDNLVISSDIDKPSYFDDVARCNEFRLWFSGNQNESYIDSKYICSVGTEVQSGTNTLSGIIVPSTAGLASESYVQTNSAVLTAMIAEKQDTLSESYVQTNSAVLTAMIAEKQDTLTFGYDEQDRINSINSSALAGGGDVPEDVMVESAIGYNAVNEISAYNGSAIAQYGAEKQWLVHDDTIVHISNSAQYALGVNVSALQRLMGIDETVLYEGELKLNNQAVLTDKPTNFDRLRFYWVDWNSSLCTHVSECSPNYITSSCYALNGTWYGAASSTITLFDLKLVDDFDKTITFKYGTFKNLTGSTVNQANESKITKIVGIHRISG